MSPSLQSINCSIQLDYPPYGWTTAAAAAFEDYIKTGKGGWIGFIMPHCWVNSMAFQCGNGSPILWGA